MKDTHQKLALMAGLAAMVGASTSLGGVPSRPHKRPKNKFTPPPGQTQADRDWNDKVETRQVRRQKAREERKS